MSSTLAHRGGVNALCTLPTLSSSSGQALLVSAGKDQTARLWTGLPQVAPPATGANLSNSQLANGQAAAQQDPLQAVAVYSGHTDAVQCAAVNPVGSRLATGGWDDRLLLWPTGDHASPLKPRQGACMHVQYIACMSKGHKALAVGFLQDDRERKEPTSK